MTTFRILLLACLSALAAPAAAEPFTPFRDCDVCPEMIALPMGEFMMGAPLGEVHIGYRLQDGKWRRTDEDYAFLNFREQPLHSVTIDIPFAMARNEVTYDEWMACVNDGGCNGYVPDAGVLGKQANGDVAITQVIGTHPVMNVSYLDALTYVDWLNQKTGTTAYRLPTEAEWEYAARAGTQTAFAQGSRVTKEQVNYADVSWVRARASGDPHEIIDVLPVPVEKLDAANDTRNEVSCFGETGNHPHSRGIASAGQANPRYARHTA